MNFLFYFILFQLIHYEFINEINKYSQKIPNSNLSIDMILVPEGKFIMGNSKKSTSTDINQNQVNISSFWISKYEITWDIYQMFMDYENIVFDSSFSRGDEITEVDGLSGPTTPYIDMSLGMGLEGYPAVNMTHFAAAKFCEWLSSITGNYYRLPTESEWEFASKSGDNFIKDNGNLDEHAWYLNNSDKKYRKVGQKKPNEIGLYDMFGNVSEWVADAYIINKNGKKKELNDPFEFNENKYPKVYRGGSWKDDSTKVNSYYRMFSTPSLQKRDPQIPKSKWWNTDAPFLGFRIVRPKNIDSEEIKFKFWNF